MIESRGQNFLKEHGLIQRSTKQRQQLLDCLGCRWSKHSAEDSSPEAYGYQILKCTGLKPGVIYPIFKYLENTGVVISKIEVIDPNAAGRPPRRLIAPAETEIGQEFATSLVVPSECPLEQD